MGSSGFQQFPFPVAAAPPRRSRTLVPLLLGIIVVLGLALSFAIVFYFGHHQSVTTQPCTSFSSFRVDGPSMEPGLHAGEQVQVESLICLPKGPERGDVIVFHYPRDPTQDFIKRVIGLPGDTLVITNNSVKVDGVTLKEPYISQAENAQIINLKLQADQYFVMGDNRPFSSDSRAWGPVPKSYIVGKATGVLNPPGNAGPISTYPDVFTGLPTP